MESNRDKSQQITNRIISFMDRAIKIGLLDKHKFAEIAGMSINQLNAISRPGENRYFTLDQIYRLGTHFKLDMNFIIYGKGTAVSDKPIKSIPDTLREVIIRLEEGKQTLQTRNKKRNTKAE